MLAHSSETESLVGRIQEWKAIFLDGDFERSRPYLQEVNRRYDALANGASADDLVALRLLRSHWAKKLAQKIIESIPRSSSLELENACALMASLRTLLPRDAVLCLLERQKAIGSPSSRTALMSLLAEHAVPEEARLGLRALNASKELLRKLGPERISKSILGIPEIDGIHTPTNILNDSGFEKIGIVDNGLPELGYAQALVVGRPELQDTFGGWMSQKRLLLENLPNWKSVKNWKSAWEAFRIRIGQSESKIGHAIRQLMNVHDDEVPKSVSDTTIAFYVRSDMEAGHIILNSVYPAVAALFKHTDDLPLLSQLRENATLTELVRQGLNNSALKKENWYSECL